MTEGKGRIGAVSVAGMLFAAGMALAAPPAGLTLGAPDAQPLIGPDGPMAAPARIEAGPGRAMVAVDERGAMLVRSAWGALLADAPHQGVDDAAVLRLREGDATRAYAIWLKDGAAGLIALDDRAARPFWVPLDPDGAPNRIAVIERDGAAQRVVLGGPAGRVSLRQPLDGNGRLALAPLGNWGVGAGVADLEASGGQVFVSTAGNGVWTLDGTTGGPPRPAPRFGQGCLTDPDSVGSLASVAAGDGDFVAVAQPAIARVAIIEARTGACVGLARLALGDPGEEGTLLPHGVVAAGGGAVVAIDRVHGRMLRVDDLAGELKPDDPVFASAQPQG